MKSKYRHWSDPDIYVQTHNETNSAKTGSIEKNIFSIKAILMYSYLEKRPIYLYRLFHVYKTLTFEFFFTSYTQNQNPSNIRPRKQR